MLPVTGVAQGVVGKDRVGVAKHLAHEAVLQRPQVTSTNAFDLTAPNQLAEDRLNPIANAAQRVTTRTIRIPAGCAPWGEPRTPAAGKASVKTGAQELRSPVR